MKLEEPVEPRLERLGLAVSDIGKNSLDQF
jgi:hypothetical protein